MLNLTVFVFFILQLSTVLFSLTQWDWTQTLPAFSFFTSFPREQSANFFLIILAGNFVYYFYFLKNLKRFTRGALWKIILVSAAVNFFCYPAFLSHDVFSYLGFGKILVTFHQNPYVVPHSFFPADPLLKFNHWPDAVSRYGPTWLGPIILIYWLTNGNIILSAYLLKLFAVVFGFILSCMTIEKIGGLLKIDSLKTLAFFALNPFVMLEMAASPHSDSLMISLALLSLFFLLRGDRAKSVLWIGLSWITKVVSLPIMLICFVPKKFSRFYPLLFWVTSWIGTIAIIAVWSINPWYLLLPFTFGVFFWRNKTVSYFLISLSMAALVRYLPYFYLGFFDPHNKIRIVLFFLLLLPYSLWFLLTFKKRVSETRGLIS